MAEQAKKGKPVMAENTGSQSSVTPQMRETGEQSVAQARKAYEQYATTTDASSARWKFRLDKLGPAHERSTSG